MSLNRHNIPSTIANMQIKLSKGNIPLYFQLYLTLRSNIIAKEIASGDRLPTTEELRLEYGIANHTVRKALHLLDKDKLINKKSKIGITVLENPIVSLESRIETIVDGRLQAEIENGIPKILSSQWRLPPHRIAALLWGKSDNDKNEMVFSANILITSKTDPRNKRLAHHYIPRRGFDEFDLNEDNVMQQYLSIPKRSKLSFRSELRPWLCDVESASILGIEDGTPVFHRTWMVRNKDDDIVFISEGINTAGCLIEECCS